MDLANAEISFESGGVDTAERQEILQNVRNILTTPVGTCPLYRDFGLDISIIDSPTNVAQNLMAVEVMTAVERWEPRVRVTDVNITANAQGQLRVKVVLRDV